MTNPANRFSDPIKDMQTFDGMCEDGWYSCPKCSEGCYNDMAGNDCTCGADESNAIVDELLTCLSSAAFSDKPPKPDQPNDESRERALEFGYELTGNSLYVGLQRPESKKLMEVWWHEDVTDYKDEALQARFKRIETIRAALIEWKGERKLRQEAEAKIDDLQKRLRSALAQKPEPDAVDVENIAHECLCILGCQVDFRVNAAIGETVRHLASRGLLRAKEKG